MTIYRIDEGKEIYTVAGNGDINSIISFLSDSIDAYESRPNALINKNNVGIYKMLLTSLYDYEYLDQIGQINVGGEGIPIKLCECFNIKYDKDDSEIVRSKEQVNRIIDLFYSSLEKNDDDGGETLDKRIHWLSFNLAESISQSYKVIESQSGYDAAGYDRFSRLAGEVDDLFYKLKGEAEMILFGSMGFNDMSSFPVLKKEVMALDKYGHCFVAILDDGGKEEFGASIPYRWIEVLEDGSFIYRKGDLSPVAWKNIN